MRDLSLMLIGEVELCPFSSAKNVRFFCESRIAVSLKYKPVRTTFLSLIFLLKSAWTPEFKLDLSMFDEVPLKIKSPILSPRNFKSL